MYSPTITAAYIKLYEASLEKLAQQYGVGSPPQPAAETEENDGNPPAKR
jgi:hypothetical protein